MEEFNDFISLVKSRYSCRSYQPTEIDRETITEILNAARLAPSACNKQPWKFMVIEATRERAWIHECYDRDWVKEAPIFIIALANHDEGWHREIDNKDHTDIDLAIAIEHICLAASSFGLGSCWICNFDVSKCMSLFNIPEEWEPVAIIPIGHPTTNIYPEKKRKSLSDIVKWGKF